MYRFLPLLLVACTPDEKAPAEEPTPVDYAAPGPWTPARRTWRVEDESRSRSLTVESWYPSEDPPGEPGSILDYLAEDPERSTYEGLLAAAPEGCPSQTSGALADGTVAEGGPWPTILMSHCHGCTRFSTATVAAHLASHGFVVLAPDHAGNTLFDELAGEGLPLDSDTLRLRADDLDFVLDLGLTGGFDVSLDATRVGVAGHSFGAVTAGMVLQERTGEGTPLAGMFIGAPPDNPLLAGVSMENLDAPLLFEVLAEDHSIGLAGNLLIAANYEAAPGPAWLYILPDAGHWSPSDLVGLTEGFMPGCGEDTRQEGGEDFSYLPPEEGRATAGALAAGFFARYVLGEGDDEGWATVGSGMLAE